MKHKAAEFRKAIKTRRELNIPLGKSLEEALQVSGLHINNPSIHHHYLVLQETVALLEEIGAKQAIQNIEPAYHNRQHIADACLALAFFLRDLDIFSEAEKILLLITILVHDFNHPGMSNPPINSSYEEESVRQILLSPLQRLSETDLSLVIELVLGTTPSGLAAKNSLFLAEPNNKKYLMQSLINDADIAASYLDELTPGLSKLILQEQGEKNPSNEEIQSTIKFFKTNFKITTPIAKFYLEI